MSIALRITKRTTTHESPFMVKDINGTTVFYAKYEHEAIAFVRGVQYATNKQAERDLWTDYESRFEVMEKDSLFYVYDHATKVILGGNMFKSELEAEDHKQEFIDYDKQQEIYFNKSGR